MFSIEIKLKVAGREVSPEHFAALFLKEVLKAAQIDIASKATVLPPPLPRTETSRENKEEKPRVVRIEEAARLLGLRPSTVRAYVANRKIASVRIGRRVFVPRDAIDKTITDGLTPARAS